MKLVFKCDYCDFMDTEEKVKEHEDQCIWNYDKRSCTTCKYAKHANGLKGYRCENGIDIPEGMQYNNCKNYERSDCSKKEPHYSNVSDILGGFFGR